MSDVVAVIRRGEKRVTVRRVGFGPPGPPGEPGPPGTADSIADRSALAGVSSPAGGATRFIREAGREGWFRFTTGNLSAQGIYLAPSAASSGASGAWVRVFGGPVDPRWWGLQSGTGTGAANDTAIAAMFATLRARAVNAETFYQSVEAVRFPAGLFEFSSTIDITDGTPATCGGNEMERTGRRTSGARW